MEKSHFFFCEIHALFLLHVFSVRQVMFRRGEKYLKKEKKKSKSFGILFILCLNLSAVEIIMVVGKPEIFPRSHEQKMTCRLLIILEIRKLFSDRCCLTFNFFSIFPNFFFFFLCLFEQSFN